MCIDCRLDLGGDLKGPEVVSVWAPGWFAGPPVGYHGVGEKICPGKMLAMSRVAALLLSLGSAKLARRNLICIREQSS